MWALSRLLEFIGYVKAILRIWEDFKMYICW